MASAADRSHSRPTALVPGPGRAAAAVTCSPLNAQGMGGANGTEAGRRWAVSAHPVTGAARPVQRGKARQTVRRGRVGRGAEGKARLIPLSPNRRVDSKQAR